MRNPIPLLFLIGCLNFPIYAAEPPRFWPVDVHEKVFADATPGESASIVLRAARNEYESGQFGVFSKSGVENLTFSVSDLVGVGDASLKISAENIRLRPVDSVPIRENTQDAQSIVVRKAPCDIPDILREVRTISLSAGNAKSVWVTVHVPRDAVPGRYSATISAVSGGVRAETPLEVEVFRFELPAERHLWVTNLCHAGRIRGWHHVDGYTDAFWATLGRYFDNLREHRQNVTMVFWIPNGEFVKATRKADGSWDFDFCILDKYIKVAEEHGVADRIEFGHIGWTNRATHEFRYFAATVFDEKQGKEVSVSADEWLAPGLQALQKFLVDTGRVERAMLHVCDEPYQPDMPGFREAAERIHENAPRIKRIEAIETICATDSLEIWVPKLSHFDRWRDEYRRLTRDVGAELWYYICCNPLGESYPNRFLDLPGSRVRALHWINYAEDLKGYLHWAYNFWGDDPFGTPTTKYPPGDTHIVYPGPLDSIRWEIERESVEDYEYFVLLANLTRKALARSGMHLWWADPAARSHELARRAVHSPSEVELNPRVFEEARLDAAREIEGLCGDGPLLIVRTFPEDGAELVHGPAVIELYGLTTPGATVTINGEPVEVQPDGTFEPPYWGQSHPLQEIVATLDGKTTKSVRRFTVRAPFRGRSSR